MIDLFLGHDREEVERMRASAYCRHQVEMSMSITSPFFTTTRDYILCPIKETSFDILQASPAVANVSDAALSR